MGGKDIMVEIKAVNHRFFEFSSRIPRTYGYLEEKIKGYVQQRVSRGKVDVNVTIYNVEGSDASVKINYDLAAQYVDALRGIQDELDLTDDLSLSSICRFSDIFVITKAEEDEEEIVQNVKTVLEEALDNFILMRQTEGERLKADLLNKLDSIRENVAKVEERSPKTVSEYRERLYQKMCEVLKDTRVDEQRILTEAAIFAEKVAVDEETVRLKSHIAQFGQILQSEEPIGRKLDFLVQEMNREANTIGSKAQDLLLAHLVVDIKSDIEKIREQIQNIE